ncbi:MAG: hypothetical protein ABIC95_05460 [archaeon]
MAVKYKQKCIRCKKNYIVVSWRNRNQICYECHKKEMVGEITDPVMKKMFDIPEEYYVANSFLRSIKISYLRYENLSEKQVEAFKNAVVKLKEEMDKEKEAEQEDADRKK